MVRKLIKRLPAIKDYLLTRLGEASTWQGIATMVAITGCKVGYGMDWGQLAAIGAIVSATIKMLFPDTKKKVADV